MKEAIIDHNHIFKSIALIHNPASGRRNYRAAVESAAKRFQQYGSLVEVYQTEGPYHATELAKSAEAKGHTIVITASGDGVNREAAKGVIHTGIPLGNIPMGTVSVLALETSMSFDPLRAVDSMYFGDIRSIDTGEVNGEPFLLNAGYLMDAEVFRRVQEPGRKKRARGFSAYILPTLQTVPLFEGIPGEMHIDDEDPIKSKFTQVWTGNTRRLGHAMLRPEGRADDGVHEFTAFTGERGYQMVPHFLAAAARPEKGARSRSIYKKGTEMTLELRRKVSVHADGDSLEKSDVFHTIVVPDSLFIVTPRLPNVLFSREPLK